jgi:exopolysaccharide production protein ExoY
MPMRCGLASIPIVTERCPAESSVWQVVSGCEKVAAALLLLAALPAIFACGVIIRLLSGRSPFIAHRRVGWRGSELWMLKLRTMWDSGASPAPRHRWIEWIADDSGPAQKGESDLRVPHPFARFCRRHSLDELPQFVHVIRGEMSLVGPRPLTDSEIRTQYGASASEILACKPGVTGLWQISGRNRLTYEERRRLDLEFARKRSIRMYAHILRRTLPEVWDGNNTC